MAWKILYVASLRKLHVRGMAVFPFILIQDRKDVCNSRLLNHERIHLKQQLELLVLPFYIWYFGEYFYYRLRGMTHRQAYHSICFEKEAYDNEYDPDYLLYRSWWNFRKYIKKKS